MRVALFSRYGDGQLIKLRGNRLFGLFHRHFRILCIGWCLILVLGWHSPFEVCPTAAPSPLDHPSLTEMPAAAKIRLPRD